MNWFGFPKWKHLSQYNRTLEDGLSTFQKLNCASFKCHYYSWLKPNISNAEITKTSMKLISRKIYKIQSFFFLLATTNSVTATFLKHFSRWYKCMLFGEEVNRTLYSFYNKMFRKEIHTRNLTRKILLWERNTCQINKHETNVCLCLKECKKE